MEYLKGSCEEKNGERCDYCTSHEFCCCGITHIPLPYPDKQSSGCHHFAAKDTPTPNGSVDDYHPSVQLKRIFAGDKFFFDEPNNIVEFSKTFVVTGEANRNYDDHMKRLKLVHGKNAREKTRQADTESRKIYSDYDWCTMFGDGSLAKLKADEPDKYLTHHNLGKQLN